MADLSFFELWLFGNWGFLVRNPISGWDILLGLLFGFLYVIRLAVWTTAGRPFAVSELCSSVGSGSILLLLGDTACLGFRGFWGSFSKSSWYLFAQALRLVSGGTWTLGGFQGPSRDQLAHPRVWVWAVMLARYPWIPSLVARRSTFPLRVWSWYGSVELLLVVLCLGGWRLGRRVWVEDAQSVSPPKFVGEGLAISWLASTVESALARSASQRSVVGLIFVEWCSRVPEAMWGPDRSYWYSRRSFLPKLSSRFSISHSGRSGRSYPFRALTLAQLGAVWGPQKVARSVAILLVGLEDGVLGVGALGASRIVGGSLVDNPPVGDY